MPSRPRPSVLALFDPLTISDASQDTPTRDSFSPSPSTESGSDKENLISTTPRNTPARTYNGKGTIRCTPSLVNTSEPQGNVSHTDPTSESFSIGPKDDDASNLCLVQLADELENACKLTEDVLLRSDGPRVPLSEISLLHVNGNNRTPQSVAQDKRFDATYTTAWILRCPAGQLHDRDHRLREVRLMSDCRK